MNSKIRGSCYGRTLKINFANAVLNSNLYLDRGTAAVLLGATHTVGQLYCKPHYTMTEEV